MQFRSHTIKLLVAGREDGLQMVALFTEHALEIVFTLQAVLLFHLLRAAGVALGTDLQMVSWKVERQSVSALAIRSKRERLAFQCTILFSHLGDPLWKLNHCTDLKGLMAHENSLFLFAGFVVLVLK